MKAFILVSLFSFIQLSTSTQSIKNMKKTPTKTGAARAPQVEEKSEIPADKIDAGYMKILQAMTATNMKLKYELGEMFVRIIQEMKEEDERNAQQQPEILTSDHLNVLEHSKAAWAIYDAYKAGGWARIKDALGNRNEKVEIKNKLLGIAIKHENINLIEALITNHSLFISYDMYKFAIRNAQMTESKNSEMIVDKITEAAKTEIGIVPNFSNRLQLGLANIKIYDYIVDHEYPMLKRALKEGLNANMRIPTYGSLLGLSVMSRCYRCAKLLIQYGADVNQPLEFNESIEFKALNQEIVPKDWSPLMVAVAHGYKRLIKLLIKASARVTYIPPGKEEERFHARAVARKIEDKDARLSVLKHLKLNASEKQEIDRKVSGKNFLQAVLNSEIILVDEFLLMSPHLESLSKDIPYDRRSLNLTIFNILTREGFNFPSRTTTSNL